VTRPLAESSSFCDII